MEERCVEAKWRLCGIGRVGSGDGIFGIGRLWWRVRRKNAGIVVGGRMPLVPLQPAIRQELSDYIIMYVLYRTQLTVTS
jgi:hypothetical protein